MIDEQLYLISQFEKVQTNLSIIFQYQYFKISIQELLTK